MHSFDFTLNAVTATSSHFKKTNQQAISRILHVVIIILEYHNVRIIFLLQLVHQILVFGFLKLLKILFHKYLVYRALWKKYLQLVLLK